MARAADSDGGCRTVISEMQQDLGGRLAHAWVGPHTSTLDLVGPGLTLLVPEDADGWRAAAASWLGPLPVTLRTLPPAAVHTLGLHRPGGAALVRPDGVPIATWWASDAAATDLARAVAHLLDTSGASTDEAIRHGARTLRVYESPAGLRGPRTVSMRMGQRAGSKGCPVMTRQ